MKYKYTKNWFINSELRHNIHKFVSPIKKYKILEIGCYEGLSSCFFSDTLLDNPNSELHCVDPYLNSGSEDASRLGITTEHVDQTTRSTFLYNISNSKSYKKIKFHNVTSEKFFKDNRHTYDIIYIDGCHEPEYIIHDITEGIKVLNSGGIIWMDDYQGNTTGRGKCSIYMDQVLNLFKGKYTVIHRGYQLAVKLL